MAAQGWALGWNYRSRAGWASHEVSAPSTTLWVGGLPSQQPPASRQCLWGVCVCVCVCVCACACACVCVCVCRGGRLAPGHRKAAALGAQGTKRERGLMIQRGEPQAGLGGLRCCLQKPGRHLQVGQFRTVLQGESGFQKGSRGIQAAHSKHRGRARWGTNWSRRLPGWWGGAREMPAERGWPRPPPCGPAKC